MDATSLLLHPFYDSYQQPNNVDHSPLSKVAATQPSFTDTSLEVAGVEQLS